MEGKFYKINSVFSLKTSMLHGTKKKTEELFQIKGSKRDLTSD